MPTSDKTLKKDLYDELRSKRFTVKLLDSSGKAVPIPEEAEVFQFNFRADDKNYGTVTITIDSSSDVTIYYPDSVNKAKGNVVGVDDPWSKFRKNIQRFFFGRTEHFNTVDMDKFDSDMKLRHHNKKLDESYYGNRNTSYSDNVPSVKMIIKHSRPLEETDARYRNIERIFLENELGERVLVPSKSPSIGRVFARHLAEGGCYNDDRWGHLAEMTEDVTKLRGFVRATKNGQFNESVQQVISEATNKYQNLRETLKHLQSSRGYNAYFESWAPTLVEDTEDNGLMELFVNSSVDPRIESALPVLRKMNISMIHEADISMFEDWADGILGEMLEPSLPSQKDELIAMLGKDSKPMSLGPDASSAIGELTDVLEDDALFSRLRKAAQRDPDRDARAIIIGWMSEQDDRVYDELLDEIEPNENGEPAMAPKSDDQEDAGGDMDDMSDMGGMDDMSDMGGMDDMDDMNDQPPPMKSKKKSAGSAVPPPPPPPPPMKESREDSMLSRIKMLSGL